MRGLELLCQGAGFFSECTESSRGSEGAMRLCLCFWRVALGAVSWGETSLERPSRQTPNVGENTKGREERKGFKKYFGERLDRPGNDGKALEAGQALCEEPKRGRRQWRFNLEWDID